MKEKTKGAIKNVESREIKTFSTQDTELRQTKHSHY
jgi:hypothetical protein